MRDASAADPMKAAEAKRLDFLKKSLQFVISIYQRTWSWTELQCRSLWDDILRAGRSGRISADIIGSMSISTGG
ncbi:hypothetical protein TspCOW1_04140 [Thiohalobacter sp. COW1]|nr:hypothetical protein TspCOW1_04140 [Thiohalobacter sp. COW1]